MNSGTEATIVSEDKSLSNRYYREQADANLPDREEIMKSYETNETNKTNNKTNKTNNKSSNKTENRSENKSSQNNCCR